MFTLINGFTKASTIEVINAEFKGKSYHPPDNQSTYGRCLYKTEKNGQVVKCAVGLFIPEDKYNPAFEIAGNAIGLLKTHKYLSELMPLNPIGMNALQAVHDTNNTGNADKDYRTTEEIKQMLIDFINNETVEA